MACRNVTVGERGRRRDVLTIKQVAERLGCSDKHVRRLVWGHQIEHYRIGGIVRIKEAALEKYLESVKMEAVRQ